MPSNTSQPNTGADLAEPSRKNGLGRFVVGELLRHAALRFGEREAFYCSATQRRFSFRETNTRCNQLAHGLTGLGLKKGDVVALLSTNRVEIVETLFALAKTGLVGIPLNYRLAPPELLSLMKELGAQALVVEGAFDAVAAQAAQQLPALRHTVRFGSTPAQGLAALDYEALLAGASGDEPEAEIAEADAFYFNLTSGTSGLPKCYLLTHYNNATVWNMFHTMEMSRQDVILTVFPMFGRVGFAWVAAGLMYGCRNVLAAFDAERVLALIEAEQVSISNLVPTMAAMLLASPKLAKQRLGSLRGLVFAGASLPAPIREQVAERIGAPLFEYYGMQETGALVVSTPDDRLLRPDSVGREILHTEVRIVDEQGRLLPPGQTGEIIGRSPSSATAYHHNPEKTAETFRQGWIHTGDLGSMDEAGYLYIRGRKKDMIVTGGQNVFAAEVEEAILSCPGVLDCAVIGLPDALWGERVTAVVVCAPEVGPTAETIVRHCREQLAGFKIPKQVILQDQPLQRTPTGKVQKFLLVEQHSTTA